MANSRTFGVRDYLRAFTARWFIAMSGPLSVPAAALAYWAENTTAKIVFGATAIGCFVFSSYWVWRIERQKRHEAEASLAEATSYIATGWGNVRVADNPAAIALFTDYGPDRNKFLALLTQNNISCWARRMTGRSDLVAVGANIWNGSGYFRFEPKNENNPGAIHQTYIHDDFSKRDIFFDLYLNLAQMKLAWPTIKLQEATEEVR
jgi:hypothetical protein